MNDNRGKQLALGCGIGCGLMGVVVIMLVVGLMGWLVSLPEGGVRLRNNMEPYATEYLDRHQLLEPDEQVVAYYDATLSMDRTEAAILTNRRVMYHADGKTHTIPLSDVTAVEYQNAGIVGDILLIYDRDDDMISIEIAPLNNGHLFRKALQTQLKGRVTIEEVSAEQPSE